jgi:hypothetical protein
MPTTATRSADRPPRSSLFSSILMPRTRSGVWIVGEEGNGEENIAILIDHGHTLQQRLLVDGMAASMGHETSALLAKAWGCAQVYGTPEFLGTMLAFLEAGRLNHRPRAAKLTFV